MKRSWILMMAAVLTMLVLTIGCGKKEEHKEIKPEMKAPVAQELSATIVTKSGDQTVSMKIYMKPDKFRTDNEMAGASTIVRKDLNKVWTIMTAQKTYMEMEGITDDQNLPATEEKIKGEVSRKEVGSETVNGHPAIKYEITAKMGDTVMQVYQWWAKDINFPVKTAAVDGSWTTEYRDINVGSQADSLFEIPAGFKKMTIPGMPAGMKIPDIKTK
ncbi:MAG: DUF4412 domain-containing protein [Smithellaceae bacterium]